MSLFSEKLSDESLLLYVWVAMACFAIVALGAIYQCNDKIDTVEDKQQIVAQEMRKEIIANKDLIIANKDIIIVANKDNRAEVERLTSEITRINQAVNQTAKEIEESSKDISKDVTEMKKTMGESMSQMLKIFGPSNSPIKIEKDKTEKNTPEHVKNEIKESKVEETKPKIEEPKPIVSPPLKNEKVIETKRKRIWWTLWTIRRKAE